MDISQEQCYNLYMSPRHFAKYRELNPKEYQTFSDNMWNGFVSVTKTIGLGKYFSYSPEDLRDKPYTPEDGQFADGEVR